MLKRHLFAYVVTSLAILAAPAVAQDKAADKAAMDPKAEELVKKAKEAAQKLTDFSATITEMHKADESEGGSHGSVVLMFEAGKPFPTRFRVEGELKGAHPAKHLSVFDGKVMTEVDHSAKEVHTGERSGEFVFPTSEINQLIPTIFIEYRDTQGRFQRPAPAKQSVVGKEKAGGVECNVVETVYEQSAMEEGETDKPADAKPATRDESKMLIITQKTWFGADDNVLRRSDLNVKESGKQVFSGSMTLEDVKLNSKPADSVFTAAVPDGYAKKDFATEPESDELKFKEGDAAPDFALTDPDGKTYKLADFKGKVVLLDFWATWCGPCKAAMPSIQKLHEKFKDKAVVVAGVNTWERGDAPGYMKGKNFTYLCLLKGDDLAKAYGISGIPTLVVIGKDGKIVKEHVGFDPSMEEMLAKAIEDQLK